MTRHHVSHESPPMRGRYHRILTLEPPRPGGHNANVAPLLVVTGVSGAGKSTLCRRVTDVLARRGLAAGGVSTVPRLAGERPGGLDALDLATGIRVPLAEWGAPTGGPSTGSWHFHTSAFDASLAWCRHVPADTLLVVDEFGPLELVRGEGWAPLVPVVRDHPGPALVVVRPALVEAFGAAVSPRQSIVVPVTPDTRDAALLEVLGILGGPW